MPFVFPDKKGFDFFSVDRDGGGFFMKGVGS